MSQNTSTAVMQRRVEPNDSLDDFPTPPWAVRALCRWIRNQMQPIYAMTCREPAANRGHMLKALREFFAEVEGADAYDYGVGLPVADYLFGPVPAPVGWTITNPPFKLAEEFIRRAIETSTHGVAMLVRTSFLESEGREQLFAENPPSHVLIFAERVVMLRGRLVRANTPDPANIDPATGAPRKASTATSYAWLIWLPGETDTRLRRIEKCRHQLERPGDYPP